MYPWQRDRPKGAGNWKPTSILRPAKEPVEPYFMIFMKPTTGGPYYGWWLYGNNRELLCTSDQFSTIDESKRNLERVRAAVPNAAVYYARE
jgi:hypothetical protein